MDAYPALSPSVGLAWRLQRLLDAEGFYVSRHASSMLVMSGGRIVATVHVHGDTCSIHLYRPWLGENREAAERLKILARRVCGRVVEEEVPWESPL
ncbi:hypothetical protein CF15_07365 [Pyrodictium occultum]|uniref:Uncharacterized protein n=1 Tax=Pyrodictium occultum TaxID=2309 RepID=A0A0V8RX44_PYROC|nr:hypothetical protein [Pyrodictium occultum]KSW12530.1 hypothetical protein CF15_07365 [Pyrodictium occultum]